MPPFTCKRLSGDIAGFGAGEEDDRGGDVRAGPVGRRERRERIACFWASVSESVIGLSMKPGATQLTVTPREATSPASDLDMPIMPALAAA